MTRYISYLLLEISWLYRNISIYHDYANKRKEGRNTDNRSCEPPSNRMLTLIWDKDKILRKMLTIHQIFPKISRCRHLGVVSHNLEYQNAGCADVKRVCIKKNCFKQHVSLFAFLIVETNKIKISANFQ